MQWTMRFAAMPARAFLLSGSRRLASTLPEHYKIIMPKVSPTMTVGRLVAWKKREGDAFAEGEDLADVESDKATMPISARDDGYMARIFVPDDTADIPLGRLLAITVENADDIAAFKSYQVSPEEAVSSSSSSTDAPPPQPAKHAEGVSSSPVAKSKTYDGPIGPAIMRLRNAYPNLDLNACTPTGPKGRLLKGDVLAAIESGIALSSPSPSATSPPTPPAITTPSQTPPSVHRTPPYIDIPITSMRRSIAKRLHLSKTTIPHRYASSSYTLDNLLRLRAKLNATRDATSRLSVNDFILKAVALSLRRVAAMNVRWEPVMGGLVRNEAVDISFAVAVEGGLMTPIVTRVDDRGIADIAKETKRLVAGAREGSLAPEEFEGGCFSVSNLGMFGVSQFSAIINPPQSGILAIGAPRKRVVENEEGDGIHVVTKGIATLSSDARVIAEDTACEFLDEFSRCITEPESMLM